MMFVGDKGKILAEFRGEKPRIIPERRMREYEAAEKTANAARQGEPGQGRRAAGDSWVAACKGGQPTYGDFLLAGPIADAFNLAAVSLRLGGRRLLFDAAAIKVTNVEEADKYLTRDYRPGWELGAAGA
jgi:hypothetical protein